jgi:hypothetical protein
MAFPSVYEMMNPLTTLRKQHFWEYFSGATLNSRWTIGGTGSVTAPMRDSVNGGMYVRTQGLNKTGYISFNNKRQYAHDGCESIHIFKAGHFGTEQKSKAGLTNTLGLTTDFALCNADYDTDATNYSLTTADGSTITSTSTTVAVSTSVWIASKLALNGTNVKIYIDGVLEVTKTTNKPTAKLQPILFIEDNQNVGHSVWGKYVEAYNT